MTQKHVHFNFLPEQLVWGWAEVDRCRVRWLWDAALRGAVWSDVGEGQCGRPAAAGDGYGGDDRVEDYADDNGVAQNWSTPNEAPPHLKISMDDGSDLLDYLYPYCFGKNIKPKSIFLLNQVLLAIY